MVILGDLSGTYRNRMERKDCRPPVGIASRRLANWRRWTLASSVPATAARREMEVVWGTGQLGPVSRCRRLVRPFGGPPRIHDFDPQALKVSDIPGSQDESVRARGPGYQGVCRPENPSGAFGLRSDESPLPPRARE